MSERDIALGILIGWISIRCGGIIHAIAVRLERRRRRRMPRFVDLLAARREREESDEQQAVRRIRAWQEHSRWH